MGRICRRTFLATLGGAVVGGILYSTHWHPRDLQVVSTTVPVRNLPPAFQGVRIAHLTDLHRGRWVGEGQVARAGEVVRRLKPDVVVLTGDYVTGLASHVYSCVEALGPLPAPLGTYAVLGNHDWWTDAATVREALRRGGIHVLSNEAVSISLRGERLWILGVEDLWSPWCSLVRACYAARGEEPKILLSHNPDLVGLAAQWGVDVVLSGHTHGGQVCLPGLGPLLLPIRSGKALASGTHRVGSTWIHVSKGVGLVFPPVRLHCPPDVSVVTLVGSPSPLIT